MKKEFQIFNEFITGKRLRHTAQREKIMDIFLSTGMHLSCEQLYELVKKKYPGIGYTTVYRTMKLLCESGLCEEIDIGDGVVRFEHKYGRLHHDHLVCTKCGKLIEVNNPEIERLQEAMAKKNKFVPTAHKLEIFGICRECSYRNKKATAR